MPELPEVETSKRGISPYIQGEYIQTWQFRNLSLRWPIPADELEGLVGQRVHSVERRGKYIKLVCDQAYVLVHLGMSGSLRIVEEGAPAAKHDHVDLLMSNGKVLRYNDPRRFGCWLYQADKDNDHDLLAKLGPEPLNDDFDGEHLFALSRKKTQSVKTFIMDSQVVVGVGNIYACESLFLAGIHPKKAAGKVSKKNYLLLADIIKQVLSKAIDQGGTTLRDFVNSDGKPGYFKQELAVYGREGEPCVTCAKPIKNAKLGQRSTFYCTNCQK